MKKGSIQQEFINLNVYIPKKRDSRYKSQKLIELQGEIHKSRFTVGDINL